MLAPCNCPVLHRFRLPWKPSKTMQVKVSGTSIFNLSCRTSLAVIIPTEPTVQSVGYLVPSARILFSTAVQNEAEV